MNWKNPQLLFKWITMGIVLANFWFLGVHTAHKHQTKFDFYYEPGYQFDVFKKYTENLEQIGYLTNKDMSRENNDGFYLQAQYYLAPTVLQLNKPTPRLNFIDVPEEIFIMYLMQETNSRRIAHNEYGQALLERRR